MATIPPVASHWVWVPDVLFKHSLLFDGDSGNVLAVIDSGTTISPKPPLFSRVRDEFYQVEIDYARGSRGKRTDFVTIYDATTLQVRGDIVLPTPTAESATSIAFTALLDDERFLATYNQFPRTSVSITDLEKRKFAAEIPTAGCAGIFSLDPRRFAMLCDNGTALVVSLSETGEKIDMQSSEVFFDPVEDPAMLAANRIGDRWIYQTFSGHVHELDFSQNPPKLVSWSLFSQAERAAEWRPGGKQHTTLHRASQRMYVIVHQGGSGTHKDPGSQVWVYDLATRERIERLSMPNFTAAFLGQTMGIGSSGLGPWFLRAILPGGGAHSIAVTQDDTPLLFARNAELGVVAVLDAQSGEHLRDLTEVGLFGTRLEIP
ncbi:MAG: hypothetical protein GY725_06980 [bacterium]|nr:hypothetical protein [bacterium]